MIYFKVYTWSIIRWFGVDIVNEGICDTMENFVWEPTLVKQNALAAAAEAACGESTPARTCVHAHTRNAHALTHALAQ